jgi:peptide/nickel transport system substrate-binding protein
VYRTSINPLRQTTQKIIKADLKSIGIEVDIEAVDASVFFSNKPENTSSLSHFYFDMSESSSSSPLPTAPDNFIKRYTCDQAAQAENDWSKRNFSRWCNAEYDQLYQQLTTEVDLQKRRDLLIRMNDVLIEDVAIIPLVNRKRSRGISNSLTGTEFNTWDADTWKIQDWQRKE